MKIILSITFALIGFISFAQKPCEYTTNTKDSIGTYKTTKEYMIVEKKFGDNSTYIFFSLSVADGMPLLNFQLIQKSKSFIKAYCFDKNSKLFFQLSNGKVITLLHIDQENCGSMLRDEKGLNVRLTSGTFMFMKDSLDEFKKTPVLMMRVKYSTDIEDYVLKKQFTSELNNEVYQPDSYFVNNIECVK